MVLFAISSNLVDHITYNMESYFKPKCGATAIEVNCPIISNPLIRFKLKLDIGILYHSKVLYLIKHIWTEMTILVFAVCDTVQIEELLRIL